MKKKIYWLAVLFFLIDLISKQVIIRIIDLASSIKIIPNFFYLTYVRNEGAAFSIFENQQILILLVTFFALFFINNYLMNQKINKIESFSYSNSNLKVVSESSNLVGVLFTICAIGIALQIGKRICHSGVLI